MILDAVLARSPESAQLIPFSHLFTLLELRMRLSDTLLTLETFVVIYPCSCGR